MDCPLTKCRLLVITVFFYLDIFDCTYNAKLLEANPTLLHYTESLIYSIYTYAFFFNRKQQTKKQQKTTTTSKPIFTCCERSTNQNDDKASVTCVFYCCSEVDMNRLWLKTVSEQDPLREFLVAFTKIRPPLTQDI